MTTRYRGIGAQMAAADRQRLEREKAGQVEKVGRLTIFREDSPRPWVKIWRGQQAQPFANYLFSTVEKREAWIAAQKEADRDFASQQQMWRAKKRSTEMQALALVRVGDILYTTWGYDQTNVDFYQVIRKTTSRLVIREIGDEVTETGFMCGDALPVKGAYKGPEQLIVPGKFSRWEGRPVRCSWYA